MSINPEAFQVSITRELDVVKNRVRNLIGKAHWGEDGRYKEAVLMNVIRRFLPSNLSLGTGFVIRTVGRPPERGTYSISKQIDIIVYDNRTPVLFSQGDFVITTNENVKAIIEVKTRIRNSQLKKIFAKAVHNGKIIQNEVFSGIFSFEYKRTKSETLKQTLEELGEDSKYINHISLGQKIFIKLWKKENHPRVSSFGCQSDFYGIYDFGSRSRGKKDLSFSYFISNVIYSVFGKANKRLWFLFPAEGGKERYRKDTACLNQNQNGNDN